jgi:Uma2 family endonuclease
MSVVAIKTLASPSKRWTKREYNECVERGELLDQRVYLFRGELLPRPWHSHDHAYAITEVGSTIFSLHRGRHECRTQLPLEVPGESMPEPDNLWCTEEQGLRYPHPDGGLLVVEVSDGTLTIEREKALEYAAAGIPEYWIVDVLNRCVEVYRRPVRDPSTTLGFRYGRPTIVGIDATIEPVSRPDITVEVAEFFHLR